MRTFLSVIVIFWLLLVMPGCTHKVSVGPVATDDSCLDVPSFQATIQPLLRQDCAKSGCHDGNSMPHDFSIYTELKPVLDDSEFYYYVIKDRIMPEDTPLNAYAYRQISCWIKNGYPDN